MVMKEYSLMKNSKIHRVLRETYQDNTFPMCCFNKQGHALYVSDSFLELFQQDGNTEHIESIEKFIPLSPCACSEAMDSCKNYLQTALHEGFCQFQHLYSFENKEQMLVNYTLTNATFSGEKIVVAYANRVQETSSFVDLNSLFNTIDISPTAICVWNEEHELLQCNPSFLKLFGIATKNECLNNFFKLYPTYQSNGISSEELLHDILHRAFTEGETSLEWVWRKKDGVEVPTQVNLRRFEIDGVRMVAEYIYDITELKKNQILAQEAEKRARAMLDSAPFSIIFWDKNFRAVDCNRACYELRNFDSKQEYLENYYNTVPEFQPNGESSVAWGLKLAKKAFKDGRAKADLLQKTKNGDPLPCETVVVHTKYNDEDIVISYSRDKREILAMLKLAEQAEERNRLMLDSMPLGVHFWDGDDKLVYCNMEIVKMFGFSTKDEYIENFHKTLPEYQPDGTLTKEFYEKFLTNKLKEKSSHFEIMRIHPQDASPMPAKVVLVPIVFDGKLGAITYHLDLREHNAMLNEIDLREKDLRKAIDIAEKNAQAKSEFLANVSHEIRTPMNGIIGLLHILNDTALQEKQKDYVQKISFSAQNLLSVINDILDFSKIDSGQLLLNESPFILGYICQEIEDHYTPICEAKNLAFTIDNAQVEQQVFLGDGVRLKQVFFHLLDNAVKFTEKGSITLSAKVKSATKDGVNYVFCVKDTGIGLNEQYFDDLFGAFSQEDSSFSRKFGGLGLGLSISQQIVQLMKGKMWVESSVNEGSAFYFEVNLKPCSKQNMPLQEEAQTQETQKNRHAYILLVEDNDINQFIAEEILTSAGYTVDIAENGKVALEMIKKNDYDLILMDIQMPIMDGLTATRNIRSMEKFGNLPVVAMSAHALPEDKQKSLENGLNDHITKPIEPKVLFSTLEYWLNKKAFNA